ncbi:MAG: SOS response-associated peptidase [Rhodospirillaceae bacterium]|nr:SOS response-associated peptidase [Rhodospirillaceae bacterium]
MCGRYSLTDPDEAIRRLFGYDGPALNWPPMYNVPPTQDVPAVVRGSGDAPRALVKARWGLIPSWAKDMKIGAKLTNARAETIAEKPSFRSAWRKRRCLIAADGFYEWQRDGAVKIPYRVTYEDGRPFAFAGLWERWDGPDGPLRSCTIVTTDANAVLAPIHHRMPVIIDPPEFGRWLGLEDASDDDLHALLAPRDIAGFRPYRVSDRVNKVQNNDPAILEPLAA